MKKVLFLMCVIIFLFPLNSASVFAYERINNWFLLSRNSNIEYWYVGVPGDKTRSVLYKIFPVKSGIPHKKPTPLPQLLGRDYWVITNKFPDINPETAPYFLTLNIPVSEYEPFGPVPYTECVGQCNWEIPGAFGLHGTGEEPSRIHVSNDGSSGCIRHSNEDIALLYSVLSPEKEEIRYYIEDSAYNTRIF